MTLGRIRTIKPENWSDESIGLVSRDARLLRDVLITLADDDGRWRHLPSAILGHGYPYDDDMTPAHVHSLAAELHVAEVIFLYESDGVAYGCFPKWHLHQVINRYRPSKLPAPSGVRCARRRTKDGTSTGPQSDPPNGSDPVPLTDSSGSSSPPRTEGSLPDQEFRAPCSPSVVAVEDHAGASELAEVVSILQTQSRFTFDIGFVGIANMMRAHPKCDFIEAAHTAVARAADPAYRTTVAARAFEYALLDQVKRRGQVRDIRAAVDKPKPPSVAAEMRAELEAAKGRDAA